ncbi:uncharacterized protein FOMMEDRAFT_29008 [Fomitiporia mediterranea MF3/22]|uniref:uncharacterized protein n=1 Tax=Fomitiporia mediterranea (strain MF3/22) TaxID=694068 RepID=UPI0004409317|nr:uncharacterized protein FOMMEDRAFT_29008 [Fomitiporia mediterranea MF3/22]EJD01857.1 hypothetical protein FOMMEDRAFT_29008 [Fomitiporia mediterranea MF3/22]
MLYKFFTFGALTIAFIPHINAQGDCTRIYKVRAGDTCNSISQAKKVSTFQLAFNNPDATAGDCLNLPLGEVLCLGMVNQDCKINTVVNSGDTCSSIAAAKGIDLDVLEYNNPGICDSLEGGQVLCTDPNSIPYSTVLSSI